MDAGVRKVVLEVDRTHILPGLLISIAVFTHEFTLMSDVYTHEQTLPE